MTLPLRPALVGLVGLGGAVGAVLRHAADVLAPLPAPGSFPWSTLLVNVVGAAALAALPASAWVRGRAWAPVVLGTGVLGGFTTLSALSDQTRGMLASGHPGLAGGYVAASLLLGLAAVAAVARLAPPGAEREFDDREGDE